MRADERLVTTIEASGVAWPEEVASDSKYSYCDADGWWRCRANWLRSLCFVPAAAKLWGSLFPLAGCYTCSFTYYSSSAYTRGPCFSRWVEEKGTSAYTRKPCLAFLLAISAKKAFSHWFVPCRPTFISFLRQLKRHQRNMVSFCFPPTVRCFWGRNLICRASCLLRLTNKISTVRKTQVWIQISLPLFRKWKIIHIFTNPE